MDDKREALLDVRVAFAQVFEREQLDRDTTYLFATEPHATLEREGRFVFIYPGVVYGLDRGHGVVWETLDVPGVDARRAFDLHGRSLEDERDRLRGLLGRRLDA